MKIAIAFIVGVLAAMGVFWIAGQNFPTERGMWTLFYVLGSLLGGYFLAALYYAWDNDFLP